MANFHDLMIFSIDRHTAERALYNAAESRWWSYGEITEAIAKQQELFQSSSKALILNLCRNDETSLFAYLAGVESGHTVALLDDGLAHYSTTPQFLETGRVYVL